MRYLCLLLAILPSVAHAAPPEGDLVPSGLKLLAALGVVLGIILLLYGASRKGFGFLPVAKGGEIKVVEMRPLGAKKALCLVRVRGEEFLLGVGAERVELLTPLREKGGASFDETLRASLEEKR